MNFSTAVFYRVFLSLSQLRDLLPCRCLCFWPPRRRCVSSAPGLGLFLADDFGHQTNLAMPKGNYRYYMESIWNLYGTIDRKVLTFLDHVRSLYIWPKKFNSYARSRHSNIIVILYFPQDPQDPREIWIWRGSEATQQGSGRRSWRSGWLGFCLFKWKEHGTQTGQPECIFCSKHFLISGNSCFIFWWGGSIC